MVTLKIDEITSTINCAQYVNCNLKKRERVKRQTESQSNCYNLILFIP